MGPSEGKTSVRAPEHRKKMPNRSREGAKGVTGAKRSSKFRNATTRIWGSMIMLLAGACVFSSTITLYLGLLTVIYFVYKEYMSLKIVILPEKESMIHRLLQWHLFCVIVIYLTGDLLIQNFWSRRRRSLALLTFFLVHKRLFLFLSHCLSLITFVLSLRKSYYKQQFLMFAWMNTGLLMVWCEIYGATKIVMTGPVWVLLPILLVIINDSAAYFFGQLLGSTPLIKVSPKKTWEGFIGGFIATIICSLLISGKLTQYPYMYCPVYSLSRSIFSQVSCEKAPIYVARKFILPGIFSRLSSAPVLRLLNITFPSYILASPFQFHSLLVSVFVSLVAPFAGFLASGLKRALKIKDFSNTIPGHGGVIDRVDCHLMALMFVFVYHQSFLRVAKQSDVGYLAKYAIKKLNIDQIKELIDILTNYIEFNYL